MVLSTHHPIDTYLAPCNEPLFRHIINQLRIVNTFFPVFTSTIACVHVDHKTNDHNCGLCKFIDDGIEIEISPTATFIEYNKDSHINAGNHNKYVNFDIFFIT
jgi:hypothetical protein